MESTDLYRRSELARKNTFQRMLDLERKNKVRKKKQICHLAREYWRPRLILFSRIGEPNASLTVCYPTVSPYENGPGTRFPFFYFESRVSSTVLARYRSSDDHTNALCFDSDFVIG